MPVRNSAAECGTAQPPLGWGETAVIIVIVVMAVLMLLRGTPLSEATAALATAGLLAVAVVHLARGRIRRSAVLRGAQRALSSCGQE
ncbi:hypothetical protein ADK76_08525 [Streptomyces griseoflavus]|uniref:hypothetical protein n=1 Tax=Streptomyces rimosus TaxID=1927 RepID=UPI0004CAB119|nr:hypothetical protein [Streptomyces rimosus]KOG64701.1 hypothetical protein ADK76_08525 [Streptomyces griseoflavus]